MNKKTKGSLLNKAFDLFQEPVSTIDEIAKPLPPVSLKPKRRAKSKKKPDTGQTYLPGLSRRGRPRSKNPVAPVERAVASRSKRLAAGAKRIELMVDADIAEKLDALTEHFKESRTDVISGLVRIADKRIARAA